MRLPDLNELAARFSDPENGLRYHVCFYSERDRRLGAKARFGVVRCLGRQCDHLGYFDCSSDVRSFFSSLHKGVA